MAAPTVWCLGHFRNRCLAGSQVVRNVAAACRRLGSSASGTSSAAPGNTAGRGEAISRAMQVYLERALNHDMMMKEQVAEYELGKRHLANIMWADPESFTQQDIDRAIAYLLPSGLFDKKARPMMKHPAEIFAKRKAAQFDTTGRPFHYLFYTGKPNYYDLMHEISVRLEKLDEQEDAMMKQHRKAGRLTARPAAVEPEPADIAGTEWITLKALQEKLVEVIPDEDYRRFVLLFERLVAHPLSGREQEFLKQYRRQMDESGQLKAAPVTLSVDSETGRLFASAEGRRKTSHATATIYDRGTGEFSVNGQPISYFTELSYREQVMSPLHFAGKLGEVDVVATVNGGGPSSQSGAVRLAMSKALCSFLDSTTMEQMRQAGLLTQDARTRERKKPGQPKARKKKTWKKR